jgi:hypothetical protein
MLGGLPFTAKFPVEFEHPCSGDANPGRSYCFMFITGINRKATGKSARLLQSCDS